MRLRSFSLVIVSSFFFLWSGTVAAQPLPIPRQQDMAVEMQRYTAEVLRNYTAMIGDWREAWVSGDPSATARFYTDDATLLPATGGQIQGRQAIERYFREHLAPGGEIRMGVADFAASGSLAYASGRYWLQPNGGNQSTAVFGTYMAVLRREGRGWRIRAQMFVGDEVSP